MPARHEFTLDNGSQFYIRRYEPFLALRILGDVQRKFLAPLASFMEAQDRAVPQDVRDHNMRIAIENMSQNLDGRSLDELARKVLNPDYVSVSIDGRPPDKLDEGMINQSVDGAFDLLRLIFEVLKVNYEEIFTRGGDLFGRVLPQQQQVPIH